GCRRVRGMAGRWRRRGIAQCARRITAGEEIVCVFHCRTFSLGWNIRKVALTIRASRGETRVSPSVERITGPRGRGVIAVSSSSEGYRFAARARNSMFP
ncbi:MAG: hypothetical protein ABI789_15900, partial [Usitatibacter sp.]